MLTRLATTTHTAGPQDAKGNPDDVDGIIKAMTTAGFKSVRLKAHYAKTGGYEFVGTASPEDGLKARPWSVSFTPDKAGGFKAVNIVPAGGMVSAPSYDTQQAREKFVSGNLLAGI